MEGISQVSVIQAESAAAKPAKKPLTDEQRKAIKDKSIEFEAVFLNQMLKPMFEGTQSEESMFGGSREEGIYHSMMVEQVGESLAKAGGIGIAKHIEKELLALQEAN